MSTFLFAHLSCLHLSVHYKTLSASRIAQLCDFLVCGEISVLIYLCVVYVFMCNWLWC